MDGQCEGTESARSDDGTIDQKPETPGRVWAWEGLGISIIVGVSSTKEVRPLHFVCSPMKFVLFTILVLCAVSCAAIRPQQGTSLGLIQMQGEGYLLSFEGSDGQQSPSLREFLGEVEGVTQLKFQYSQGVAVHLASKRLRLNDNKMIPKEKFWSFLQILLAMNDFVFTALESEGKGYFLVEALAENSPGGNVRIRSSNPYIAPRGD